MLLGFKPQFVNPILQDIKWFTLRDKRKVTPKLGETLHMYTGLRTNNCKPITKKHTLKAMYPVHIKIKITGKPGIHAAKVQIVINNLTLSNFDLREFVVRDGFENIEKFIQYWTENYSNKNVNIKQVIYAWHDIPVHWHKNVLESNGIPFSKTPFQYVN